MPDAPVVAWWPNEAPANPSKDLLGAMARSRITDAMHFVEPLPHHRGSAPQLVAEERGHGMDAPDGVACDARHHARPAAAPADQHGEGLRSEGFLPMDLLAAWLRLKLNVPVIMEEVPGATAVTGVYLTRADGTLSLERPDAKEASPSSARLASRRNPSACPRGRLRNA